MAGFTAPPRPPSGHVRLYAPETGGQVLAILSGDADRGGGVGGWQASARMLRPEAHWWASTPTPTLSLPLVLDVLTEPATIERRLATLYAMGQPYGDNPPPMIKLLGDLPPQDRAVEWKMDDLTIGARLWQPLAPGTLWRATVQVQLSALEEAKAVDPVSVKRTRQSKSERRQRTIRATEGDTLRAIAVRHLGSSGQWTQIREWNKALRKVDPDAPLRRGTRVVLK